MPEGGPGISALGQVKNHYFLHFNSQKGPAAMTGMGVRFTQFDNDGEERLESLYASVRILKIERGC